MRFQLILLLCLAVGLPHLRSDELHLDGKKPVQGIFLGVPSSGKLSFQVYGQEQPDEFSTSRVKKLSLDQPVKARCFLKRNRKQAKPGTFNGMQDGKYLLRFASEKRDQEVSQLELHKLEIELDMKHYMLRMEEVRRKKAEKTAGKGSAAAEFLTAGRQAVLHFTSPELSVNSRQGNLAKRLCDGSRNRADYVQVLVDSLDNQVARANSLSSLPQFWFYSANGRLVVKLVGRFTDEDIEQAFLKAGKSK